MPQLIIELVAENTKRPRVNHLYGTAFLCLCLALFSLWFALRATAHLVKSAPIDLSKWLKYCKVKCSHVIY